MAKRKTATTSTRSRSTRSSPAKTSTAPQAAAAPDDLQAAAALVLEREAERKQRAKARARRKRREREKAQLAAVHRMQQSVELMKWCIVIITAIMLTGIAITIGTLWSLHNELETVKAEVDEVRPTVERVINEVNEVADGIEQVRLALQNPMQTIGGLFGSQLDAKLNQLIGGQQQSPDE